MIPTHLALAGGRKGKLAHVVVDGELRSRTRGNLHRHSGEALCAKPYELTGALLDDATVTLALTGHSGSFGAGREAILGASPCPTCAARFRRLFSAGEVEHHCRRTAAGPTPAPVIDHLPERDHEPCPRCGGDYGTFVAPDGETRATCMDCGLAVAVGAGGKVEVLA